MFDFVSLPLFTLIFLIKLRDFFKKKKKKKKDIDLSCPAENIVWFH